MKGQLSLFGGAEPTNATAVEPIVTDADREVRTRLPSWIHFGTSSWSFPGWKGLLYRDERSGEELGRVGLRAYAQQPLFRTASVDRSYYGPLRDADVAAYAGQIEAASSPGLPPFRLVSKVWEEITTAVFPSHPRYAARAGEANPSFLDVDRFLGEVLAPYIPHAKHFGPFVFELTPMPRGALDERTLGSKLERFLARLPSGFAWAFELRNQELLTPRWHDVLKANGAANVFTYWTAMPSLRAQLASHGAITSRFVVARLMLPPFMRYAQKKAEYAPFDRIVAAQPDMRDDVMDILRAAEAADVDDAYVLVNNKAEGSAPLTVRELAIRAAKELTSGRPRETSRDRADL